MSYSIMNFTAQDIEKYQKKQHNLELCLYDERAFGNPSKTTLRKLEELRRIIDFDDYVKENQKLKTINLYYKELLKEHNIVYTYNLKDMKEYIENHKRLHDLER